MANSYAFDVRLACFNCGQLFQAETWLVVDTTERPDLANQIINGSLHQIPCPACGRVEHLEVPFLLYRPEHEPPLVFCLPDGIETEQVQKITWPLLGCLAHNLGETWQEGWLDAIVVLPCSTLSVMLTGGQAQSKGSWLGSGNHPFPDQESRIMFNRVLGFFHQDSPKKKHQFLEDHRILLTEPALSALGFLLSLTADEDNPGDDKSRKLYPDQFRQCLKVGTVQALTQRVHD